MSTRPPEPHDLLFRAGGAGQTRHCRYPSHLLTRRVAPLATRQGCPFQRRVNQLDAQTFLTRSHHCRTEPNCCPGAFQITHVEVDLSETRLTMHETRGHKNVGRMATLRWAASADEAYIIAY